MIISAGEVRKIVKEDLEEMDIHLSNRIHSVLTEFINEKLPHGFSC